MISQEQFFGETTNAIPDLGLIQEPRYVIFKFLAVGVKLLSVKPRERIPEGAVIIRRSETEKKTLLLLNGLQGSDVACDTDVRTKGPAGYGIHVGTAFLVCAPRRVAGLSNQKAKVTGYDGLPSQVINASWQVLRFSLNFLHMCLEQGFLHPSVIIFVNDCSRRGRQRHRDDGVVDDVPLG